MAVTEQRGAGSRYVWKRGLFMLLFAVGFGIGQALLNICAIVQFFWLLFAGEPNRFVIAFGRSLAIWLAEVARFLICASEDMPFPWKNWPDSTRDTGAPSKSTDPFGL